MDSMRSLNTSLPATTSPRKRARQPPLQLLQAFKTAALQVTNLYKAAASDRERSHDEGYQDALEDMLNFLDNENLGVGDGEGWRVRQWVTERLQESPLGASTSDEEEELEEEKRARSSSPVMQRRSSPVASPAVQHLRAGEDHVRPESAPPEAAAAPVQIDTTLPSIDFTFRAAQAMPADTIVPAHHDLDMDESEAQENNNATSNNTGTSPPVQINVFPRHLRSSTRNSNNMRNRRNHRSSSGSTNSSLGVGAGMKRQLPFDHFFDIGGVGNGKDEMGGGGKRSKFT
ncbi:hypothetical protein K490DRAFT_61547 [Saccharata proteae CBS 121410]|uniref:Uncharacterized protein n=1 Tax=Saccharata proteae CBS 121410 TaxID=1314787 RepID=A0A9P4I259_9PEZI|nr:hypothetical protein K490DRAFT_61547 [Saccharata proteae CBS 121410]